MNETKYRSPQKEKWQNGAVVSRKVSGAFHIFTLLFIVWGSKYVS